MCNNVSLLSLATDFDNLQEMIKMCKDTTKLYLPRMCEELNNIYRKMMSFEPENRPTIDEVLACLEAYTRASNTKTSPQSSISSDQDHRHREAVRGEDRIRSRLGNSDSRHLRENTTDLNETSDYGTDMEVRNEEDTKLVQVPIWMSANQHDWYQKMSQLLIDIEKKVGDKTLKKIRQVLTLELRKSKNDTQNFLKWAMKEVCLQLEPKDAEHCIGECRVMKECNHPNLVKLYESFKQDNNLYIIMEYCERGSLKDFLQTTELEEKVIVNFMTQICKALQFLHRRGKIHRDVKTANIFITKDWNLKLGDMALTRDVQENFVMTKLSGTPVYMSPEVIQCKPYDQKADIWSLGCCFYEMCNKVSLFSLATDFDNLQEMIKMCKDTTKLYLPRMCEELNEIYRKMMSFEPENRPTIDEVLACLEAYTRASKTKTSPQSSVSTDQDHSHRQAGRDQDRTRSRLGNSYSRHLRENTTDLNETSDYGTDTEVRKEEETKLVPVPVTVWMSVDQYDWYQKTSQLLIDIEKKVGDKTLEKIRQVLRQELRKSKNDTQNFLAQVQRLIDSDTFRKCGPDLHALWVYASNLNSEYPLAF